MFVTLSQKLVSAKKQIVASVLIYFIYKTLHSYYVYYVYADNADRSVYPVVS